MRPRTSLTLSAAGLAAVAIAGCGSAGSDAASRPSPPAPVVVSAIVGPRGLSLSPARLGAGPVLLTATNQGRRAVALTVTRAGRGRVLARTAPLNPQGVTQLQIDLGPGRYTLAAIPAGRSTDAARSRPTRAVEMTLTVGRERASSGGQTLLP